MGLEIARTRHHRMRPHTFTPWVWDNEMLTSASWHPLQPAFRSLDTAHLSYTMGPSGHEICVTAKELWILGWDYVSLSICEDKNSDFLIRSH